MTNNEIRELTAAELDLIAGAMPIYMKIEGVIGRVPSVACDGIGAFNVNNIDLIG
jgi:hypothetical protein